MIVDSSALVAILRNEEDAQVYLDALVRAKRAFIATPVLLEFNMVMLKEKTEESVVKYAQALNELNVTSIPFTSVMASQATFAFLTFGKGRGHKAQLNFADCMSYAAAKVEAMPLLFKGNDFRHTDVECAI
jgi:ribonuclease VapC